MGKISLKLPLLNPIVIASLLISLIWVSSDINERLVNGGNFSAQPSQSYSDITVPVMVLTSAQKKFIEEQYSHFIVQDEEAKIQTPEQLTLEEQLKQQGLLQNVYVKDYKLTLKAVIKEQNDATGTGSVVAYALINKTHVSTGKLELVKVLDGQLLEGFLVSILTSTQVELKRTHPQGEQNIILTMYRVATNSKE
ncbi:hypothetical protein [Pseudoalteromonas gelatinilytica]